MFETVYILGEIEGHDGGSSDKNTKYDEIIPRLVSIEIMMMLMVFYLLLTLWEEMFQRGLPLRK